jgi:hypothetical protein
MHGEVNRLMDFFSNMSMQMNHLVLDKESKEYKACTFKLNHTKIIYREAKITPLKIGQFVTVWQRNEHGITAPFAETDNFDFIIIACKSDDKIGHFIFSKKILVQQRIITTADKDGKRGMRIYPIWDVAMNAQAIKTQAWQLNYFVMNDKEKFHGLLLQ